MREAKAMDIMSPLPTRMTDRWRARSEPGPGEAQLYWHILMSDQPQVRALAAVAQRRLDGFPGLHFTPEQRLHLSIQRVGLTTQVPGEAIAVMVDQARRLLQEVPPITFTLGQVLYHPEAIVLGVRPDGVLDPLARSVGQATGAALALPTAVPEPIWVPHVTVAYSTEDQEAAPIIAALGHQLPECPVTIDRIHLIAQHGAERSWNWQSVATISAGG
jgi:2'-5' RNA ligase